MKLAERLASEVDRMRMSCSHCSEPLTPESVNGTCKVLQAAQAPQQRHVFARVGSTEHVRAEEAKK